MNPFSILRGQGRRKKANAAQPIPTSLVEKENTKTSQYQSSTLALRPRISAPLPLSIRPKEPPPRLELPIDIRSSPFSKATYSPTSLEGPKLRRVRAMQDMSPTRFGLMDLPTELRLHIFSFLFGTRTMALDLHGNSLVRKNFYCLGHKRRTRNITAILRTCRRMRDEGQEFLWDHTTFMIGIGGAYPGSKQLKMSISLHNMRHVILNVRSMHEEQRSELRDLLLSFDRLKTAEMRLDFTSHEEAERGSAELVLEDSLEALLTEKQWKIGLIPRKWGETQASYWFSGEDMSWI